jgi:hypothetical protein
VARSARWTSHSSPRAARSSAPWARLFGLGAFEAFDADEDDEDEREVDRGGGPEERRTARLR